VLFDKSFTKIDPPDKKLNYSLFYCVSSAPRLPPPQKTKLGRGSDFPTEPSGTQHCLGGGGERHVIFKQTVVKFLAGLTDPDVGMRTDIHPSRPTSGITDPG